MPSSATSCTRLPWADTSRRSGRGTSRSSARFMRVLSTCTDGRSSPLGKLVSACWMSTTAPGRSTCPASKSTPAIKAPASVAGSARFWRKHSARGQDLVLDGPYTLSDGIARSPGTTSCTTEPARCSPITPDLTRRPRRPGSKPPTGTTACLAAWRYDGECDGTTVSWPPSATGCSSSADHRPGSPQCR